MCTCAKYISTRPKLTEYEYTSIICFVCVYMYFRMYIYRPAPAIRGSNACDMFCNIDPLFEVSFALLDKINSVLLFSARQHYNKDIRTYLHRYTKRVVVLLTKNGA